NASPNDAAEVVVGIPLNPIRLRDQREGIHLGVFPSQAGGNTRRTSGKIPLPAKLSIDRSDLLLDAVVIVGGQAYCVAGLDTVSQRLAIGSIGCGQDLVEVD